MYFEKDLKHVLGVVNTLNFFHTTVLLLAEAVVLCCMQPIVNLTMRPVIVRSTNVFMVDCTVRALMCLLE
jgi:uncharacterized protein involved in cysteine biosynthesis